jgi:hypothetical protein
MSLEKKKISPLCKFGSTISMGQGLWILSEKVAYGRVCHKTFLNILNLFYTVNTGLYI